MEHHFNTTMAKEVGVFPAIIANNIKFWIDKNIANKKHFIDGRYWTYNSITALQELFDYLSVKQIRSAIDKLVAEGYLIKGDFSENRFNRPTWYSLEDKYYAAIGESKSCVAPQGETLCPTGQTIVPHRANHTDTNPDSKQNTSSSEDVLFPEAMSDDDNKDAVTEGTLKSAKSNNVVTKAIMTPEEFVAMYHEKCPTLPKILKLTQKRKDAVTRRIREMGDIETIDSVFDRLNKSDFCNGISQTKWKANFDWLIGNDTIWVLILEGKYDNKNGSPQPSYAPPSQSPTEITNF